MLLFCKSKHNGFKEQLVVIPLDRVFEVIAADHSISVHYDSGELLEVEGSFEKVVDSVDMFFDSEAEVNQIMGLFYKAVFKNLNAFYFGLEMCINEPKKIADHPRARMLSKN